MEPGPQFRQLPMFMTAHELKHDVVPTDLPAKGEAGWAALAHEARNMDVSTGVREPVQVLHPEGGGGPRLIDGHHRVARAYQHSPLALLPVQHRDVDTMMYEYKVKKRRDSQ